MIPLLIDRRTAYVRSASGAASLLTLPLGPRSFLDHLAARLGCTGPQGLLIMPGFRRDEQYEQEIRSAASIRTRVIPPDTLWSVLGEYEPSDQLLVVDPARWPINGFDLGDITRRHNGYGGFVHAVAVGADSERVRERVERDDIGRVKRVQRLYDQVNWPEVAGTAHFLSIGPVGALGDIGFTSLPELRTALSAKGALNHDLPLALDVVDLSKERGFLALNESVLAAAVRQERPHGFSRGDDGILVGEGCQIHSSARLIGPLILHRSVAVGEGATIIGPTVVGMGSQVGAGAVVAQSVVAAHTVVAPGSTTQQQLVSGCWSGASTQTAVHRSSSPAALRLTGVSPADEGADLKPRLRGKRRQVHLAIKRVMDVVLSAAALVVLAPLLAVVAVLIKRDSPGPVLFSHRREQRGGKEFQCFKFRTMSAGAHSLQRALYKSNEVDGPQFKLLNDPRVTRVGRWIRATNVDELPQLINVLLGHMSLVGPRPSPFRENQICVPWRRARLSVRPGITGLWQLCRDNRRGGDFHQWIFYDMAYVRHFSIWLDLKILLATVLSLAGRYRVPLSWLVHGSKSAPGPLRQAIPA
ncbi:MAG: sugar transferase [Phycisphaerales bacterium]|nr:MAG: sugar transferase [Phycisphaerales bacterium]